MGGAHGRDEETQEKLSTRVNAETRKIIERIAATRRTTPAQVARILLEDGAKELARDARGAP
jgi:hypothetical protein